MQEDSQRTRIGFLGAGPHELELLLELQAAPSIEVIGAYDADPQAPGLAMAELVGVPAGYDTAALERLRGAEFVVLPQDRRGQREAVRWAGGLRAELVPLPEARRRWSEVRVTPVPAAPAGAAPAARLLEHAIETSSRLQDRSDLADWVLGIALRAVGANGGSIQLLAPETSELYLAAGRGLSERLVRLGRHRLGDGISGKVAEMRAAQVTHGPQEERPRERGMIHAAVSVPLEDDDGLVGVLNVSSTLRGKSFGDAAVRTLQDLAPQVARLLRDAERQGSAAPQLDLPRFARRSETETSPLEAQLGSICEHAREVLGADGVALYLATEDGDWARAHASASAPQGVRRADLDRAFLERRWIHSTSDASTGADDAIAAAVDRALEVLPPRSSHVVAPLDGLAPVGVLVFEFAALEAAQRCMQSARGAVAQLGFCIDALVRDERTRRRVQGYADVARALGRLATGPKSTSFETALGLEAASLVGGRVASVRKVDETRRTYSRPATYGIEPEAMPGWRPLDARVTERTLVARRAVLTTAATDGGDAPQGPPARSSLLSVPILWEERIIRIVNVYDKLPRSSIEMRAFTDDDRTLLESFAVAVAHLLASADGLRG